MHNNYFLIRQLVTELQRKLLGASLVDSFSQNKNELILQFVLLGNIEFNIIAHLNPQFTCLAFPEEYHKAKKNTAQVFKDLLNSKINSIKGFENERAFAIHFDTDHTLLFKLFGNQSNVILFSKGNVIDIFRSSIKSDFEVNLTSLDRPIDQSEIAIETNLSNLRLVYPTLDRRSIKVLEERVANLDSKEAVREVKNYIEILESPETYYIYNNDGKLALSLAPSAQSISEFDSPILALSEFFKQYIRTYKHQSSQQTLLKGLQKQLSKTKTYIAKTRIKKEKLAKDSSYKEIADILMANLHLIVPHMSSIELENFYSNSKIKIKLNPKLSGQKNAEKYYNKSKNLGIEIKKLAEILKSKEQQVTKIESDIDKVQESTSARDLQKFSIANKSKPEEVLPFKIFLVDGFTILVGKNAKNNDLLTLKYAKKNDLFFHAKDVSGSHVILKEQSGKRIPNSVLEKTAAIAAYYSKRKTDTLCPVGYTPKKYIRKPKGSPPGLVMVEREKVLLIKPELPK